MLPPILRLVKANGFAVFEGPSDFDLDLIGIRSKGRDLTDQYDDMLCCLYKQEGQWTAKYWPMTTDRKYCLETASQDFKVSVLQSSHTGSTVERIALDLMAVQSTTLWFKLVTL